MVGHEGANVWCAYRGTCTKCAAEHVRRASDEEMLAFQALPEDDKEMMEKLFDDEGKGIDVEEFKFLEPEQRRMEGPQSCGRGIPRDLNG